MGDHRVLVPVDIVDGETVPEPLLEPFLSVPLVVLGYHEIPDQTPPAQARRTYEDDVEAELASIAATVEGAGGTVETVQVYTRSRRRALERLAVRLDCDAILLVRPVAVVRNVLVAVGRDGHHETLVNLLTAVFADTTVDLSLLHVATDGETQGRWVIEGLASELDNAGLSAAQLEVLVEQGRPTRVIRESTEDYDMLVIGESRPSLKRLILQDRARRISRGLSRPTLVVRSRGE